MFVFCANYFADNYTLTCSTEYLDHRRQCKKSSQTMYTFLCGLYEVYSHTGKKTTEKIQVLYATMLYTRRQIILLDDDICVVFSFQFPFSVSNLSRLCATLSLIIFAKLIQWSENLLPVDDPFHSPQYCILIFWLHLCCHYHFFTAICNLL